VEVRTRDVWTLRAGVAFARAGGANRTKIQLVDDNVLGTGRSIASSAPATSIARASSSATPIGTSTAAGFYLDAEYANNSDGGAFWASSSGRSSSSTPAGRRGRIGADDQRVEPIYAPRAVQKRFVHQER
jgi:hypothetical protein